MMPTDANDSGTISPAEAELLADTKPAAPPPRKPPLLEAARGRHEKLAGLLTRIAQQGLTSADLVHDVRVWARRLGEVARLLESFMDKPTAKAVDGSLKALRQAMGELRDSDVTREHLAQWKMPAAVKAVARELAGRLEAARGNLAATAQAQAVSPSVQGSMVVLARVLEDQLHPERAAAAEAALERAVKSALRKRAKQMRTAFGKAARKQTPESLHAARIAVKKLRYVSELADEAALERGVKRKVRELKRFQELLGDHHDVQVIVVMLHAHLHDPRPRPLPGLAPAWRKWHRAMLRGQAKRATTFFMRGYAWMNQQFF